MKKILCCLLGIALLLSLLTGCGGGAPASVSEGGTDGLLEYLTGSGSEEYMLSESAELDLTDAHISTDRTVLLDEGVTLKLIGTFTPGEGCITVRAGYDNDGDSTLDLSGLSLADTEPQEATLLEIRSDVKLVPPAGSDALVVDTSNEEWTSVKSVVPQAEEPQQEEPPAPGPDEEAGMSTPEEFLQAFGDPAVSDFELANDITVELGTAILDRELRITCNGHVLTLSGTLDMQGGILEIGEKPDVEVGTADISGLTVNCDRSAYTSGTSDIIFIGLNFKHIIGEPTLGEGLLYEIPDSGEAASVKLKEVITPEMHEAKLQEELTQYLSGVDFPGGVGISAEFLADGVLEINLDNPVIDKSIGVSIDGGMTLILTGSVTFDGGIYGFELYDDSSGTATVDISGLEINGTKALGKSKSPDILKITGADIDFIFNESDPHIKVEQAVGGDWYYLRYVQ